MKSNTNAVGSHSGSNAASNVTGQRDPAGVSTPNTNAWAGSTQHNVYQMPSGVQVDANFQNIYNAYMYSYYT